MQDQIQSADSIILKILNYATEGGFLIKGDDRQEDIARQGQILRGIDPAMPMVILPPLADVALLVVLIFDPPVASDRTGSLHPLAMIVARIQAAQEAAGVAPGLGLPFFEGFLIHPATRRLPGAPGIRDLSQWRFHQLQDAGWVMSLIATDMNEDGRDDLLVSDRYGKTRGIFWLQHPGPDKTTDPTTWIRHDLGGRDRELKFITRNDLDQDGQDDVIAIEKKAIVWFRLEDGQWIERVIPLPNGVGGGKSVVVCDIDGNGRNDLVFSCEGAKAPLSGVRWLSWDQSPLEGPWTDHEIAGPEGLKYDRLVVSDVDGDGDPDLLCCEERDQLGVFWYENPFQREVE